MNRNRDRRAEEAGRCAKLTEQLAAVPQEVADARAKVLAEAEVF
jgi:hypothetical protein